MEGYVNNQKAYELLVNATKATFNATGRSWDMLSETEKGERINAQRAGFAVVLESYQAAGYGMRTKYMQALVEATETMSDENALDEAATFFRELAQGRARAVSPAVAVSIASTLERIELADNDC